MSLRQAFYAVICSFAWASLSPGQVAPGPDASTSMPPTKTMLLAGTPHRVQVYKLESVEISGSTRLTSEQLMQEMGLVRGTSLDDNLVMNTRTRLLGLGLFKSAILMMRRGSKPGMAKLIVEVEDDDNVLSDWAVGGELAVTLDDSSVPTSDPNTAPMDYRLSLVGRNLFTDLHRGAMTLDLDSTGSLKAGQIAYGLPRFTQEDSQFDAQLAVVSPYYRYLDALGFGGRGEGLWSYTLPGLGEIQYGAAMYVNRSPDYAVRGFPDSVAGPKVAFYRETRLHGFFPGAGDLAGASILASVTDPVHSVLEFNLAHTWDVASVLFTTLEGRALAVGSRGYSYRLEARTDLALGRSTPGEDQAALFMRLRGGQDGYGDTHLVGSEAIIGLRYHSSGFIAELAVRFTHSPTGLAPKTLGEAAVEARDR